MKKIKRTSNNADMDRFIKSVELLSDVERVFEAYPEDVRDVAASVLQPDLQQISKQISKQNRVNASLPRTKVEVAGKEVLLTKAMLEEHRADFIRTYKTSRGEVNAACIKFNISRDTRRRFLNSD